MHYTHGNYSIRFATPEAAAAAQEHIGALLEAAATLAGGIVVQQNVLTNEYEDAALPVETRPPLPDLARDPDIQAKLDTRLIDFSNVGTKYIPSSPATGIVRRGINSLIRHPGCSTLRDIFIFGKQSLLKTQGFKGATADQTIAFVEGYLPGLKVHDTPSASQIATFCPDLEHVPLRAIARTAGKEAYGLDNDLTISVAEARRRIDTGHLKLAHQDFIALSRFEREFTSERRRYEQ